MLASPPPTQVTSPQKAINFKSTGRRVVIFRSLRSLLLQSLLRELEFRLNFCLNELHTAGLVLPEVLEKPWHFILEIKGARKTLGWEMIKGRFWDEIHLGLR